MSILLNTTVTTTEPEVSQDSQGTDVENFTTDPSDPLLLEDGSDLLAEDGGDLLTEESTSGAAVIDSAVRASVQQMDARDVANFQRRGYDVTTEVYTQVRLAAGKGARLVDNTDGSIYEIKIPCEDMAGRGRWFCTVVKRLGTDS